MPRDIMWRYLVGISCGDILWRYLHSSIHHVEISTLFYISCRDILWRYLHSFIYHVEISTLYHVEISTLLWVCLFLSHVRDIFCSMWRYPHCCGYVSFSHTPLKRLTLVLVYDMCMTMCMTCVWHVYDLCTTMFMTHLFNMCMTVFMTSVWHVYDICTTCVRLWLWHTS